MRSTFILLTTLLALGCTRAPEVPPATEQTPADAGIYGGRTAALGSRYTKQIVKVLLMNGTVGGACSGTFIAPDVVLTAGHCIQETHPTEIEITYETDDTHVLFKTHGTRFLVNPDYVADENSTDVDFALIKTADKTPYAVTVLSQRKYRPGTTVASVGYGLRVSAFDEHAIATASHESLLKFALLKLTTSSDADIPTIACTEKTCISSGDSGGPLFAWTGNDIEQIGVTSDVTSDGFAHYAGVEANIDWLRRTLVQFETAPPTTGTALSPDSTYDAR